MRLKELKGYFKSVRKVMRRWRKYRWTAGEQQYWHITQEKRKNYLLVAHIDTVQTPRFFGMKGSRLYARGLDDRLGVAMAFLLHSERDDCDVLITDDEELGASTAEIVPFEQLEGYNCIIELDRAGNDFVTYGLADDDLVAAYKEYSHKGWGSFSDICSIKKRPCGCINVGIGYELAHSMNSYAEIKDVNESYCNLNKFMTEHAGTHFKECEKIESWGSGTGWYNGSSYKSTSFNNYSGGSNYTPKGYWSNGKWVDFNTEYGTDEEEDTESGLTALGNPRMRPEEVIDPTCESCGCDLYELAAQYTGMCKECVKSMFGDDWEDIWPSQQELDDWIFEEYERILAKDERDEAANQKCERQKQLELYDGEDVKC